MVQVLHVYMYGVLWGQGFNGVNKNLKKYNHQIREEILSMNPPEHKYGKVNVSTVTSSPN